MRHRKPGELLNTFYRLCGYFDHAAGHSVVILPGYPGEDSVNSTVIHENTHRQLFFGSSHGLVLACLQSLIADADRLPEEFTARINRMFRILFERTRKLQEGIATYREYHYIRAVEGDISASQSFDAVPEFYKLQAGRLCAVLDSHQWDIGINGIFALAIGEACMQTPLPRLLTDFSRLWSGSVQFLDDALCYDPDARFTQLINTLKTPVCQARLHELAPNTIDPQTGLYPFSVFFRWVDSHVFPVFRNEDPNSTAEELKKMRESWKEGLRSRGVTHLPKLAKFTIYGGDDLHQFETDIQFVPAIPGDRVFATPHKSDPKVLRDILARFKEDHPRLLYRLHVGSPILKDYEFVKEVVPTDKEDILIWRLFDPEQEEGKIVSPFHVFKLAKKDFPILASDLEEFDGLHTTAFPHFAEGHIRSCFSKRKPGFAYMPDHSWRYLSNVIESLARSGSVRLYWINLRDKRLTVVFIGSDLLPLYLFSPISVKCSLRLRDLAEASKGRVQSLSWRDLDAFGAPDGSEILHILLVTYFEWGF